jgi:hypothetical protein
MAIIIGATCYSSIWTCQEGLKLNVINHWAWKETNNNLENPIIFDLILWNFKGTKKFMQAVIIVEQ